MSFSKTCAAKCKNEFIDVNELERNHRRIHRPAVLGCQQQPAHRLGEQLVPRQGRGRQQQPTLGVAWQHRPQQIGW
jgi:hypothetical protein